MESLGQNKRENPHVRLQANYGTTGCLDLQSVDSFDVDRKKIVVGLEPLVK